MDNVERAEGFWWVRVGWARKWGDREEWAMVLVGNTGEPMYATSVYFCGLWATLSDTIKIRVHEWGPYLGKEPSRTQALLSAALQGVGNEPGWPDSKDDARVLDLIHDVDTLYGDVERFECVRNGEREVWAHDGKRWVKLPRLDAEPQVLPPLTAEGQAASEAVAVAHAAMGRVEPPLMVVTVDGARLATPEEEAEHEHERMSDLFRSLRYGIGEELRISDMTMLSSAHEAEVARAGRHLAEGVRSWLFRIARHYPNPGGQIYNPTTDYEGEDTRALDGAGEYHPGPEGIHAALAYLGRECAASDGRALGVLLDPKAYDALVRHYPDAIAIQSGGLAVMTEAGTIVVERNKEPKP